VESGASPLRLLSRKITGGVHRPEPQESNLVPNELTAHLVSPSCPRPSCRRVAVVDDRKLSARNVTLGIRGHEPLRHCAYSARRRFYVGLVLDDGVGTTPILAESFSARRHCRSSSTNPLMQMKIVVFSRQLKELPGSHAPAFDQARRQETWLCAGSNRLQT